MTPADEGAFFDLFAAMARGFDKKPDPAIAREYFAALVDYPLGLVERAKLDLIRGSKFWPRVVDWRRACDTVRSSTTTPHFAQSVQTEDGQTERLFHCLSCEDTGWRPACGCRFGAMSHLGECERHPREVNGKVYRQAVMACACRDSNPVFQAGRPRVSGAARDAGGREAA